MVEVIIPQEEILIGQPVAITVLKYSAEHGKEKGLEMLGKRIYTEIDGIRYEYEQLMRINARAGMKIKLIQESSKIEDKGTEKFKSEDSTLGLNFLVKQDLWLSIEKEPDKILGWTTVKPKFDNGQIKKDTALVFSHIYEDALNFVMIPPGRQHEEWYAEFSQKEIEYLTDEGALELIKLEQIVEVVLVSQSPSELPPNSPELTQGPILIRESMLFEFNNQAILPKDLYIVMGQRENMQSQGKLIPGEKISLRHLLDHYSLSLGKNLIYKIYD